MIHSLTVSMEIINIPTTSTTLIMIKTVILATMICFKMMSITAIQILATSTTMVQTPMPSTILIQRIILIMSSYVIIEKSIKVLIPFKNMSNLCHMLLNSFKNMTQMSTGESSNTLISEKKTLR